jgi:hypothetical protein
MPRHEHAFLKTTSQGNGRVSAWERHVGDLPAFGAFLLPLGVPGCLLSEECQSQMQVVSVKQTTFVMDEEKLIILVQGHECLYNLQHNDYDNSLVKDNCWKEIAGEWQGHDRVAAGDRHVMCESGFNTAGERHGMCESAFNCHFLVTGRSYVDLGLNFDYLPSKLSHV